MVVPRVCRTAAQQSRTRNPQTSKTPICPRCHDASFVVGEQIVTDGTATTQWTC
jgi:hypothetical protein